MTGYILTSAAESDLRNIIRYTQKQWGNQQVTRYITLLEKKIAKLANGQGVFKDLNAVFPTLRMARHEYHYVFYLMRPSEPALIVAILHERMDLMARLAFRLKV